MKKFGKLGIILTAMLLIFFLAGCSNGNEPSTSEVSARFVEVTGTTVTGSASFNGGVFISGRTVTINTFYMSDHEVTQSEYQAVMGNNPSVFNSNPAAGEIQANRPVENMSWYDAIVYCNKKSIAEGLTPCYTINGSTDPAAWGEVPTFYTHANYATWNAASCNWNANGYRLPTEAEWEYAARGGSRLSTDSYSGSNMLGDVAWYSENSGDKTHEVKKKAANSLGIYDMSGNVWELCWDWRADTITSSTPATGPSTGTYRVRRGGCYAAGAVSHLVSFRTDLNPYSHGGPIGFRVVRSWL